MSKDVSIIVNCRNGSKYLDDCLSSIKNQKFKNWELIFFDNCSTDNSYELYKKYKDKRFRYIKSNKVLKLYKARNLACKKAEGKYIAFLDVDDWWDVDYLFSRSNEIKNTKYDFLFCENFFYFQKQKKFKRNKITRKSKKIYDDLAKNYFVIISGLMIKNKFIKKIGYFYEHYNVIGDFELVMRGAELGKFHLIKKGLLFYRIHGKNFLNLNRKMYFQEFNDWFSKERKKKSKSFLKNYNNFTDKLNELEISYLLFEERNIVLFNKILNCQKISTKFKFLLGFCLPVKFLNYFFK